MKRFKILSILIAVFMLGACSNISKGMNYGDDAGGDHNGEPGGGDVVDDSLWPDEIKQEMIDYFGETLPYVELNETTIYSDYDSDYEESGYGHYYVGDDSEVNALADYGDALLEAGYEIVELEGEEFYGKETDKTFLYVSYDYYEATDEYDAGNQIDVFFTISEVEITPEALIENGYEEYQDWPQAEVEEVIAPYTLDLSKVEADGPFYVYCGEDTDIVGDLYPFVSICVEGDYVSELEALLEEEGYQDLEGYYFSEDYMVEISVYSQSGFTVIEI